MPPFKFKLDYYTLAALLAAAGALALMFRMKGKTFLFLRLAAFFLILWFALEPAVSRRPGGSGKPALAVMVDVSRSMGIEDKKMRLEKVRDILKASEKILQRDFELSWYQFSQNSILSSLPEILKAKPLGRVTDLTGSLRQVAREREKERPAVLLFSDGTHNAFSDDASGTAPGVPVFAVGIGSEKNLRDLALRGLRVSDFAFKGRPVELSVKLHNLGFKNKTVPVHLLQKMENRWQNVETQPVTLREDFGETDVRFRFLPRSVGGEDYRLEVTPQAGEMAPQNNVQDFHLEVGREKIRVLYICGQPSPEYAYLRQILKSDPSLELISFVILRNPENVVPVPEEQLSLIPFPSHDIFVRTLSEFDLLIFENFSYSRLGILPSHLDNIRAFVESRGGGFIMIGGENSFGRGGYKGTAIEGLLPVLLDPDAEGVEEESASLRVLEPQHPLFDLAESLKENERTWKSMPPLSGYHRLPGLKNGATLLATFEGGGSPAMAAWQKGKGRVLALSTLSTWQWALSHSERGLNYAWYVQFWRNAVRWMTGTLDAKAVRIVLNETRVQPGKKLNVRVWVQQEKMKSVKDLRVTLTVSANGKVIQDLPLVNAGRFEYAAEWPAGAEGEYVLTAAAVSGSERHEDRKTLQTGGGDLELDNPYPDPALLEKIAAESGGEFFSADEFSAEDLKAKIKTSEKSGVEIEQKSLWTQPWLFALLAGLLLLEWAWRRYRGEI